MPRLTNATYLDQRHRLMNVWEFRSGLLAELAYFEQRDLHRFFAMSHEMYDDDALSYRHRVTEQNPSLPSQAGRAYAHLQRVSADDMAKRANPPVRTFHIKGTPRPKRVVQVRGLARPELDVKRLARLLVSVARADENNDGELAKKTKR